MEVRTEGYRYQSYVRDSSGTSETGEQGNENGKDGGMDLTRTGGETTHPDFHTRLPDEESFGGSKHVTGRSSVYRGTQTEDSHG